MYIVYSFLAILIIVSGCNGKEWRGIVPLHSTRNDVVRLLGPPNDTNDLRSIYRTEKEDVYIVFSGGQFCDNQTTKITEGTVLLVQVAPRVSLSVVDFQLNMGRLKEFSPSPQDPNWRGFIDEEEGLIVRAFKERIDRIFYVASAKDRSLCPSYYAEPKKFAQIVLDFTSRPFDRYSDLVFEDEKARLDNFAIYLNEDKSAWKAYVVGYPAPDGVAAARARTDQARRYLISIGLDENRILTVIAGQRDKLTIELYALPPDLPAPTPNPKTTPSAVDRERP